MSGVYGHLARRGLEVVTASVSSRTERIAALEAQAELYEQQGQEVYPWEIFAIVFVALCHIFSFVSLKYSLGEIMSSLVMIEDTKALVVTEAKPVDSNEIDATLEKAPLMDEEVSVYKQEPVTNSIKKTMLLVDSVGGRFTSRWRGVQVAIIYHIAHAIANNLFTSVLMSFMAAPVAFFVGSAASTLCLARLHMVWTHAMITKSSTTHWTKRLTPDKKTFKALALPSLIHSGAQLLVVLVPAGVFFMWGGLPSEMAEVDAQNETLRLLFTLATAAFVALAILLPASVTLTRVEAALLPEDMETIVNFDRTLNGSATFAITETDTNARALCDAAWRSFDKSARLRLIKFYAKYIMLQVFFALIGLSSLIILIETIGTDKLAAFVQAGSAQLQLMSMDQ